TGGGTVCAGNTANVSVDLTASNGSGPYTVTLTNGGGTQTGPGPVFTFSVRPATTMSYTIASGTDSSNCAITTNDSVTVTVYPIPSAAVSGSTQICAGGQATIQAALSGTAPFNVHWSDGFNQTGVTGNLASRVVSSKGIYTVTALSDAHCIEGSGTG